MTARLALSALVAAGLAACAPTAPVAPDADMARPPAPDWRQHDVTRPQPPRVEPADAAGLRAAPPSDAVVLIGPDGSGLEAWESQAGGPAPWTVEDGALVVRPGSGGIQTKETFGDVQLHVEWMPATEPEKDGQDRSNSGVFFMDNRYEVQVLDSWENPTYADGRAAAIYGQFPPLADAARAPGEWQSYDVFFRRPRFGEGGALEEPARLTVLHNGVLVQNNEELPGMTMWLETIPYTAHPAAGPIGLQDHGSPARFRNLWVRRLPERPAPPAGYAQLDAADLSDDEYDRLAGEYDRGGGGDDLFVIERTESGLGLSMPWRPGVLRLVPTSPTTFELEKTAGRIEFALGADGRPTGLTFRMGGGVYEATRVGA